MKVASVDCFREFVLPSVICPSSKRNFPMESASAELLPEVAGAAFGAGLLGTPPIEEKFQRPLGSLSMVTWGFTTVISVTFNCWEKISGISSTPTFTVFAVRKGAELNLGSSLTETSSIPTEPVKSDKLKFPSCTLRPSASDAFDSMVGLNLLIGIRNGTTNKITMIATTTIPIHFTLLLMGTSKGSLGRRRRAPQSNARGMISQSVVVNRDWASAKRSRRPVHSYYNVVGGAVAQMDRASVS